MTWGLDWSAMASFHWGHPSALLLLLLIPAFWWRFRFSKIAYLKAAYRYSPYAAFEQFSAAKSSGPLRRLAYPVWVSLLMVSLSLAVARPLLVAEVPVSKANMMLVIDISLSMMADDVDPSRLEAAKQAAQDFLQTLPKDVKVGLELFAGNNYVVQPLTSQHSDVSAYLNTLDNSYLQMRTEIGSALRTAVGVLRAEKSVLQAQPKEMRTEPAQNASSGFPKPLASVGSDQTPDQVIVLISDGDSQEGYPWPAAVDEARRQGIAIHTIGIGSAGEATILYQGQRYPVRFSENTLRQIALSSGGEYFRALGSEDLKKIYDSLKRHIVTMERQEIELSWFFAALALLILSSGVLFRPQSH